VTVRTRDRRVRRPALVAAVVVLLVAVVGGGYGYATAERRGLVQVVAATAMDDVLIVEVASCGGEPAVTELDQAESEVCVAVEATTRPTGPANQCLDSIDVRLDAPLHDRVLVDGSNGQAVEVQRH